jgi:hypothetical protein
MFISCKNSGYDRHDQQFCTGRFLIMMQPDDTWKRFKTFSSKEPLRCLVGTCKLSQCGQFMMGTLRVKGKSVTVSGAYGSDGLPKSVPRELYEKGVALPAELYELWSKGGGWNSAGSEADAIRAWALQTFPKTKK